MLVLLAGQSNMSGRGYLTENDVTDIPGLTALRWDGVWIPAADPFNFDRLNMLGLNNSSDPFEEKTLDISVDSKGIVYVGQDPIALKDLVGKVRAIVTQNPSIGMVISGDKAASYGTVIEVMALLRSAGYTQVGLKTDAKIMEPK